MKRKLAQVYISVILWIFQLAAEAAFIFSVWRLNILPGAYAVLAAAVLTALLAATFVLMFVRNEDENGGTKQSIRTVLSCAAAVVLAAVCAFGTFAMVQFESTVNRVTSDQALNSVMGVYVLSGDKAQSINDAADYTFAAANFYKDDEKDEDAVKLIENEVGKQIKTVEYTSLRDMADDFLEGKVDAIILNEAYISLFDEFEKYEGFSSKVRLIYECSVSEKGKAEENEEAGTKEKITTEAFLVYLSGSDTREKILAQSRSDVNIIAVVNPQTKQVLLINTPRDYYIPNPVGNGAMDKLTHCGLYGVECSMEALENLYDEEISYYAQINFTGFEKIIDAIGGITVYSDQEFVTNLDKIHIDKGDNYLSGKAALSFARERYALAGGDNARGKNQMKVIKAVIEKMSAGTLIKNYSKILESIEGMFTTNMTMEEISALIKMQVNDNAKWNVLSYAVTGPGGNTTTYSTPSSSAYVMYMDEDMVQYGSELIDRVVAGEILTEADMTPDKEE